MKKLLATLCALAALALLAFGGIKNGQTYSGGRTVHWETDGSTHWWLTVTDEETTQASPHVPGDEAKSGGLGSGDELVGPDGETYRVDGGKLQKRVTNPAGNSSWANVRATAPGPGQGKGEDGGTLPR